MGRIVGGFATSHAFFSPDGVEEQARRVQLGMIELRRRVQALRPDVLVLAGSDHLNTFSLAMQVTLGVGVADDFTTLGDGGAAVTTFPGHRDFAESFTRFAAGEDFELVQIEEVRPDHGMALPRRIIDPQGAIPTVPVYINTLMPVPPSPRRCHRLGGVLRRMVETIRPPGERVVVVAVGGLSHWICVPEQGRVAEAFDRRFMAEMIAGRSDRLAQMGSVELREAAGNGGAELAAWLFMAGAVPAGAAGDVLYYEPISQWATGMGALALTPGDEKAAP